MSDDPLISVIVPAYNCAETLPIALQSVLDQTYSNLEIIVVDDSSTDGTLSVAKSIATKDPRIKVIASDPDPERFDPKLGRNVNAGWSARNSGFKEAKGELITFQDADDYSFPERIETQLALLRKHGAVHVTIDWVRYEEGFVGKKFNIERYLKDHEDNEMASPERLCMLANESKGFAFKLFPHLAERIPFHIRRKRLINRIFFGSLASYPGSGNCPIFKREVIEKVTFRKLPRRVWPSFMGRGADRDFNFQVAETFRNSYVFFIPLYAWRVRNQNGRYPDSIGRYIID